jgi:hypothetical protein
MEWKLSFGNGMEVELWQWNGTSALAMEGLELWKWNFWGNSMENKATEEMGRRNWKQTWVGVKT